MRYAVHHVRRPGLTRDLPFGPEDLLRVVNTATLVHGEQPLPTPEALADNRVRSGVAPREPR